ncbi:MAG TPA: N-acetylmuramoyl-L-alanine amidase [Nocardioidaceae bacterium]|nr:N-acetylmuramoyl-L-alanine amidase [Nocardioidaceae bacterium]
MRTLSGVCLAAVLVAGSCSSPADDASAPADAGDTSSTESPTHEAAHEPLRGKRIVIDPGHQLGNARFPDEINRPVPAGGFTKPCNTTGTSTDDGYAEATLTWQVSTILARKLRRLGATVHLTRHSNRRDRWGPCVSVRGRAGNRWKAHLKISVHADGSTSQGRGFHLIAPTRREDSKPGIHRPSKRLAKSIRHGLRARHFAVSNYVGENGLDFRGDLGTLNLSEVPTVMAELGNMRNRQDASIMTSPQGRQRYARGLVTGVRTYLHR